MAQYGSKLRETVRPAVTAVLASILFGCSGELALDEADRGVVGGPIIGGSEVPERNASFVAALFQDFGVGEFFQLCGGTFIAEDLVLTAAHCTFDVVGVLDDENMALMGPTDPSLLRVARRPASIAGVSDAEMIPVERIYVHPAYDPFTTDNDIAVWKLGAPSRGPVLGIASARSMAELDRVGGMVRAFGYGATDSETFEPSDVLLKVDVPLVVHSECQRAYYDALGGAEQPLPPEGIVTNNMLCAGTAGKDTCYGDSGGPLAYASRTGWRLLGITSWGLGCDVPGLAGVYTRASNFADWVHDCGRDRCDSYLDPLQLCLWGFSDCDGDPANGCEANTLGPNHCGACGAACGQGQACVYDWDLGEPTARCSRARPLKPRLECVYDPGDDSGKIASFGYDNRNEDSVFVRRGPSNRFAGVPGADETLLGFPGIQDFRPGRYGNAPISAVGSDPVSWRLRGPDGILHTVRVGPSTRACTENPLEQDWETPRTLAERRYQLWKQLTQRRLKSSQN
jgi:secreted trypsin-like serine protease